MVWRAERKCFAWEFSARATNTLQMFAYETQVFLVCAENIGMDEAILRMTLFIFLKFYLKPTLCHSKLHNRNYTHLPTATTLPSSPQAPLRANQHHMCL